MDIGLSAEGFVRLMQEALGPERRHEAAFVSLQFAPGHEVNIFDLQVGCEYPLPLERAFLENFLLLATLPPDATTPFEGMAQMIGLVVDEAYRLCTEAGGGAKHYRPGVEPAVDAALRRPRIALHPESPHWRDVVDALCDPAMPRIVRRRASWKISPRNSSLGPASGSCSGGMRRRRTLSVAVK